MTGIVLFKWIIHTSLMSIFLVLLITIISFIFKDKFGKQWTYYIWFIVVIRLSMPFSIEAPMSIYNFTPTIEKNAPLAWHASSLNNVPDPNNKEVNQAITSISNEENEALMLTEMPKKSALSIEWILFLIWLLGASLFSGYAAFSSLRLWMAIRKEGSMLDIRISRIFEDARLTMKVRTHLPLVQSDVIKSPALFGFIRPRLLIPKNLVQSMNDDELKYIMLHELAHFKQNDIAIGWITLILQVIHWFNPFIWFAFHQLRLEREMVCDAIALKYITNEEKNRYGLTLIKLIESLNTPLRSSVLAGITEDKEQIKKRIIAIKSMKPISVKRVSVASVILAILIGITLTDPISANGSDMELQPNLISAQSTPSVSIANGPFVQPVFLDDAFASAIAEIIDKTKDSISQSDLDSIKSLTIIGPYACKEQGEMIGFSKNAYYDKQNNPLSDEGNIKTLNDLQYLTQLEALEIDWQSDLNLESFNASTEIKSISLLHNNIKDTSFLGSYLKIRALHLGFNRIESIKELAKLSSLSEISLNDNMITSIEPLTGLPKLNWLDISDNPIQDIICISQLKKLTNLYASNIPGLQMSFLAELKKLEALNVSMNNITSLDGIEALDQLSFLSLSGNQITNIDQLKSLKKLNHLDISDNPIQDISILLELPSLKTVYLWGDYPIDQTIVDQLREKGVRVEY